MRIAGTEPYLWSLARQKSFKIIHLCIYSFYKYIYLIFLWILNLNKSACNIASYICQ